MTVGSPKLIVRVPEELRQQVLAAIARRNARCRDEAWDLSSFVRTAIRDKLHHMERSRKRKTKGSKVAGGPSEGERAGAA